MKRAPKPSAPWLTSRGAFAAALDCYKLTDGMHAQLVLAAARAGVTCHTYAPRGRLVAKPLQIAGDLTALGWRSLIVDRSDYVLVHPRGMIEIERDTRTPVTVHAYDDGVLDAVRRCMRRWVRREPTRGGRVYMLQLSSHGPPLYQSVGRAGRPLRRGNYTDVVLEGYDHVAADLTSREPCGRLVLLSGPPGGGKTHLVRGLLAGVRARFVLVQGDVSRLVDPASVGTLCDFARRGKGGPVVLVLEDADDCLVPRAADNIGAISALLNMTDGLLGAMFDLRIVATTNARTVAIDPAITRPGRICRRIDVAPLQPADARRVLVGLLGREPTHAPGTATLAEVYARARDEGAVIPAPTPERERAIGFSPQRQH